MKRETVKKEMIKEIQTLAKKLGSTPKKLEYEKGKNAEYYFGTWNNFLIVAGLRPSTYQNYFNKMTDEELLKIVKKEINRIGSTYSRDYNKNRLNEAPSRSYLEKRLKLTWNQILISLGFEPNVKRFTKKQLINNLKKLYIKLGKTPTTTEARKAGLNIALYNTNFGGFNNALKLAGLDIKFKKEIVKHNDDELLKMYINLCKKLGKAATTRDINNYLEYSPIVFDFRFGSINKLRELAGYDKYEKKIKYSKDSIKKILIKEYKKHNRKLTNKELAQLSKKNNDFPSVTTILIHFKTTKMSVVWEEIKKYM